MDVFDTILKGVAGLGHGIEFNQFIVKHRDEQMQELMDKMQFMSPAMIQEYEHRFLICAASMPLQAHLHIRAMEMYAFLKLLEYERCGREFRGWHPQTEGGTLEHKFF